MKKKVQVGEPKTKIPLKGDSSKYPNLWFENQEDLDRYDSLMRKKIYIQNFYGEEKDKDYILNGFKTTFGIFVKEHNEKLFKNSDLKNKQLDYVSKAY